MKRTEHLDSIVVKVGGRHIEGAWDRVARYCGLPWSGGDDETWAFRYYDSVSSPPDNIVRPEDVLATAALHPGLSRGDLTFFHQERRLIADWLDDLPTDVGIGECDADVAAHVAELATWEVPVSLPLLTKVLHRKRPRLIPLLDRHVIDWFRPVTGERNAKAAWVGILPSIRDDIRPANSISLRSMANAIEEATSLRTSDLRVMDIIIWMGSHA